MKMKLSLWKVLSIAVVLILSCAVTSNAFMVKVDEDTWADFAVRGQLSYKYLDNRSDDIDYHRNYFEMTEAEFYVKGQLNDLIEFFTQWECVYIPLNLDGTKVTGDNAYKKERAYMKETGLNFLFAPEFKLRFGRIRIPVSRYHQRSDYGKIIPTDYFNRYDVHGVFTRADVDVDATALNIREPGAVFYGDLLEGMFRYHLGLFNQRDYDYEGLRYTARIAFTPTMLGFKPESSLKGTRKDSYLGKKDILTIGAGYSKEKIKPYANEDLYPHLDNELYAVDATFEKKFGSIVPNLGFGYIKAKETHRDDLTQPQDSEFWYAQGQLLYDEVIGIGKPAIGAKFERMESDNAYLNEDTKSDRVSVALNYFLQGYNAMISLCVDNIQYRDGAKDYVADRDEEDSMIDYSLWFQFKF